MIYKHILLIYIFKRAWPLSFSHTVEWFRVFLSNTNNAIILIIYLLKFKLFQDCFVTGTI